VAPVADAAGYAIDVHVDGVAGGGNYAPKSFSWGQDPRALSFVHAADASSVVLLGLSRQGGDIGTATLHVKSNGGSGAAVITIQMTGVHIDGVTEAEDSTATDPTPMETVTLRFRQVTYTYQAVNPVGQPIGAPVSFTWKGDGGGGRDH